MSEPLRILLVEGSGRGFLSHYVHALASGLNEAGQAVRLVTGLNDELGDWPLPFEKSSCLRRNAGDWLRLMAEVRRFRPEVVHFQWMHDPVVGRLFTTWLHRRGIVGIYTPHNLLPHCGRWIAMPVFGRLYRGMDRVVARDAHMAWAAEEMLGVPPEKLALLPGSPNLIAHPDGPRTLPPEVETRTGDETRLLFFGHGSSRKGLSLLLEVVANSGGWPVHFVLAGAGVTRSVQPALMERAARTTRLTVIDRYVAPSEVAGLFADADVLLMPYVKRCSSPILDLAAAFKVPVLRSDRVENPRFRDGVHGYTIAAGSADVLRASIAELTRDPSRLQMCRDALAKEESVVAAARRLSESHVRMYRDGRSALLTEAVARSSPVADYAPPASRGG